MSLYSDTRESSWACYAWGGGHYVMLVYKYYGRNQRLFNTSARNVSSGNIYHRQYSPIPAHKCSHFCVIQSPGVLAIHLQKKYVCGIIAYSCHAAPSCFRFEPGYSVLTPGKICIKPSGGDGRLHNRRSAVLLPFKYHSARLFGFTSEDYVLACQVLCHKSAKKNRTALSLITQAWHGDEIPESRLRRSTAWQNGALAVTSTFWEIQLRSQMNSQCLWME